MFFQKQNTRRYALKIKVSDVCWIGVGGESCAFSGAPRSAIINCRLCRQVYLFPKFVRQSVLLPQNGSHPQLSPRRPVSTNKNTPREGYFVCGGGGRARSLLSSPTIKIHDFSRFFQFFGVFAWFFILSQTTYGCLISCPRHQDLQVKSIEVETDLLLFIFVLHPLLFCTFRTTAPFVSISY